jgi:glutathione S-transferase
MADMITLRTFGPAFGLPDPSPFVIKAELLLKLAGLGYRPEPRGLGGAPKGKLPYIDDDGVVVADSTFIRLHVEKKYSVDFDAGLSPRERAAAWAIDKMCEDHLYWVLVHRRWNDDASFAKGPRHFFDRVPALARPLVIAIVRRQVRRNCRAHGIARHSSEEITALAAKAIGAIADTLGDRPYLMGDRPCGADATVFAFVASFLSRYFEMPERGVAEGHANLAGYESRLRGQYFPGLAAAQASPD